MHEKFIMILTGIYIYIYIYAFNLHGFLLPYSIICIFQVNLTHATGSSLAAAMQGADGAVSEEGSRSAGISSAARLSPGLWQLDIAT
jgi:hypothetical protein